MGGGTLRHQCHRYVPRRADPDYVLEGELDIQQLFHIEDLSDLVANEYLKVPSQVARAKTVLAMTEETGTDLSVNCQNPTDVPFWQYCTGRNRYRRLRYSTSTG